MFAAYNLCGGELGPSFEDVEGGDCEYRGGGASKVVFERGTGGGGLVTCDVGGRRW